MTSRSTCSWSTAAGSHARTPVIDPTGHARDGGQLGAPRLGLADGVPQRVLGLRRAVDADDDALDRPRRAGCGASSGSASPRLAAGGRRPSGSTRAPAGPTTPCRAAGRRTRRDRACRRPRAGPSCDMLDEHAGRVAREHLGGHGDPHRGHPLRRLGEHGLGALLDRGVVERRVPAVERGRRERRQRVAAHEPHAPSPWAAACAAAQSSACRLAADPSTPTRTTSSRVIRSLRARPEPAVRSSQCLPRGRCCTPAVPGCCHTLADPLTTTGRQATTYCDHERLGAHATWCRTPPTTAARAGRTAAPSRSRAAAGRPCGGCSARRPRRRWSTRADRRASAGCTWSTVSAPPAAVGAPVVVALQHRAARGRAPAGAPGRARSASGTGRRAAGTATCSECSTRPSVSSTVALPVITSTTARCRLTMHSGSMLALSSRVRAPDAISPGEPTSVAAPPTASVDSFDAFMSTAFSRPRGSDRLAAGPAKRSNQRGAAARVRAGLCAGPGTRRGPDDIVSSGPRRRGAAGVSRSG